MSNQTRAYAALIFICIVWGTTYLAIRVGVMHYPAFLFAGVRQALAGIILTGIALAVNQHGDFSSKNIGRQMLIGFLMLSIGNGCVTWGEKYVPSGIAALICSMMPIFAVLYNLLLSKNEKFNLTTGAGMILGTLGVALIFRHDISQLSNPTYLLGILAVLFATSSWAMGSIINKKNTNPINPFLNSGMQLFFGGLFMLIASPMVDDLHSFELINKDGLIALAYLVIFGSVLAYAAYMYALNKLPVGIATIYAYINPLVAVVLGYFALKEELNIYTLLSFVTIIIGVYLVNSGYRKQHIEALSKIGNKTTDAFPEEFPVES